jgi:hypothetical protein
MEKHGITIFDGVDSRFLEALSKAFRLRYYDSIQGQEPLAFLSKQLLAELDSIVARLEEGLTTVTTAGAEWKTPYRAAVEARDAKVWNDNYLLQGLNKKAFMELPRGGMAFSFLPDGEELLVEMASGAMSVADYQGRMQNLKEPLRIGPIDRNASTN